MLARHTHGGRVCCQLHILHDAAVHYLRRTRRHGCLLCSGGGHPTEPPQVAPTRAALAAPLPVSSTILVWSQRQTGAGGGAAVVVVGGGGGGVAVAATNRHVVEVAVGNRTPTCRRCRSRLCPACAFLTFTAFLVATAPHGGINSLSLHAGMIRKMRQ